MTVLMASEHFDAALTNDVLAHLDAQLVSARRLLQIVLEQGAAIRGRDVQNVVSLTGLLQAELQRRTVLERDRARLLERAGARLGISPTAVSINVLHEVMDPVRAEEAHARSAELRGMLEEIQREHHVNRALMNQELAFLDHLLRLADSDAHLGYDAAGDHNRMSTPRLSGRHRVLDLEV
ncbi:MAG TPA: flagellar export chaperone FlgN [Solirubrobacteraceae bacterium]|nr:flagellar export chaperone FlgN [Solirubrobacteraceae bacterium]